MTLAYFLKKLEDVKINDYLSFAKLLIGLVLKPFYKKQYQHCWVVCERPNEARDNGFHFFKYVRQNCKDINCFYAIDKDSKDCKNVINYGNIIQYGSIKHWLLYLCADYNLSSQKGGKPNTAVCALLELLNLINSRFVFLQHGVTINDCSWAHARTTQLEFFITTTLPETNYIKDKFGFEPNKVVLTGFPRFDNLHDNLKENNYILIMPTWRSRFILQSQRQDTDNDFLHSHYKSAWEDLLNSELLAELIERAKLKVVFFPHPNMQQFMDKFVIKNKSVKIANWCDYDIQEEMKKAAMMITDYSSVFYDMVYMKKPVIFYQFDYEQFRKYDYQEGYFDYKHTPYGKWCNTVENVLEVLGEMVQNCFVVDESFLLEHRKDFLFYDRNNSARVVELLRNKMV